MLTEEEYIMSAITFFIVLSALASLGILIAGGVSMARGGEYDDAHALPLMGAGVVVQALAVGLLMIAALFWV